MDEMKMEDINEIIPDIDNMINDLIEKFNAALNNPQELKTTALTNDIEHLKKALDLNDDTISAQFSEIVDEIVENFESQILLNIKTSSSQIKNKSAIASTTNLKEEPLKSSAATFFRSLFSRKRCPEPSLPSLPSLPSIPSVNSTNDEQDTDPIALQAAETEIKQLIDQGPAGILHLSPLSNVLNRGIRVWSSSMYLYHEVGRKRSGEALNIQYHTNPNGITGHWTLPGNEDPKQSETNLNDCLFDAIAAQTGQRASDLRAATIDKMKEHIRSLSNRIQVLAQEHQCGRIILMIGGAKYTGTSANTARQILDASQKGRCHPGHMSGHPRGHASNPTSTDPTASAENYSRSRWITAFTSPDEQNRIAHQALITSQAQNAMNDLNRGGESRAVHISASQFTDLPAGLHFNDGVAGRSSPIKELVLVLRHHAGHANDPEQDVFVHTFYPKLES